MLGTDASGTLVTENKLIIALSRLGEYAEAEALDRKTLEKRRRILGRDHSETLLFSGNFANSLSGQGKCAEAV